MVFRVNPDSFDTQKDGFNSPAAPAGVYPTLNRFNEPENWVRGRRSRLTENANAIIARLFEMTFAGSWNRRARTACRRATQAVFPPSSRTRVDRKRLTMS